MTTKEHDKVQAALRRKKTNNLMRPKKKKTIHASCTDWDQQTKEE